MANSWFSKEKISFWITSFLTTLIAIYQIVFRPILPRSCRFAMSCSDFSLWAVRQFGPYHGTKLAIKRILSCHPFHKCG